jgi:hypothetical protein
MSMQTEKHFQQQFIGKLKTAAWHVESEVWDLKKANRLDIVAYHRVFDAWFCFELKVPYGIKDYTCCLRQMIRYRNSNFSYPIDLFSLIVPHFDYGSYGNMIIERFFWRWGFGLGSLERMEIEFVNGESIATINLETPIKPWFSPKNQIAEIKRRAQAAWREEDADES